MEMFTHIYIIFISYVCIRRLPHIRRFSRNFEDFWRRSGIPHPLGVPSGDGGPEIELSQIEG